MTKLFKSLFLLALVPSVGWTSSDSEPSQESVANKQASQRIWEGLSRNDYLSGDLVIDMEIEAPEEKALSMVPALVGAKLLDRVAVSFGKYGTDYLQHMVRKYADKGWRLSDLRSAVFAQTGGGRALIPIQSSELERQVANRILETCGLDFIEFVADPSHPQYDTTRALSVHQKQYETWKKVRKYLNAVFAFGAALTAGAIEASSLSHIDGQTFGAQMRPFIGLGLSAGLLEYMFAAKSDWFNRNFWSPHEKPWIPAISLSSLMDLTKRIIWPRGFYASLVVNTAIPVLLVQIAEFLAALPHNPVPYSAPNAFELATGVALFTVSLGAAQIGLSRLNARGGTSEFYRYIYETVSGWINNAGRATSLVPGLGFAGQLVMGAFAVGVTAPLWFKLAIGDQAFNEQTAALLDPSRKRPGIIKRQCSRMVGWLSNVIDFRRVNAP